MILAGITSVHQLGGAKRKHQWDEHVTNKFRINPTNPTSVSMKPLPDYKPTGYNIKLGIERPINFDDLFRNKTSNQLLSQKFPHYVSTHKTDIFDQNKTLPQSQPIDLKPIKIDVEDFFYDAETGENIIKKPTFLERGANFFRNTFFESDSPMSIDSSTESSGSEIVAGKNETFPPADSPIDVEFVKNPKTYSLNKIEDLEELASKYPGASATHLQNIINEKTAIENAKKYSRAKSFENFVSQVEQRTKANQLKVKIPPKIITKKRKTYRGQFQKVEEKITSPESLSPPSRVISSKRNIKTTKKSKYSKKDLEEIIGSETTSPSSSGSNYSLKNK